MSVDLGAKAAERAKVLRAKQAEALAAIEALDREYQAKLRDLRGQYQLTKMQGDDAERLSKSFGANTQETLTGQASTDLSRKQAESNVAEFGFTASLVTEGNRLLEKEERAAWRADWTKCPHPDANDPWVRSSDNTVYIACWVCGAVQCPPGAAWQKDLPEPSLPCQHTATVSFTAGDPYIECVACKAFKMERTGVWQNTRTRGMEQT